MYFSFRPTVCTDIRTLIIDAKGVPHTSTDVKVHFDPILQITGDTSFNHVHLSAILSTCDKELRKNMSLYDYNNETGVATPPVEQLNNICENDCNRNGVCVESKIIYRTNIK